MKSLQPSRGPKPLAARFKRPVLPCIAYRYFAWTPLWRRNEVRRTDGASNLAQRRIKLLYDCLSIKASDVRQNIFLFGIEEVGGGQNLCSQADDDRFRKLQSPGDRHYFAPRDAHSPARVYRRAVSSSEDSPVPAPWKPGGAARSR